MNGIIFILLTALFFGFIGLWYVKNKKISLSNYVGNPKSLRFWKLSATLLASGLGAWVLFGPAETMIYSGVYASLGYALGSALSLLVFIFVGRRIRKLAPKGKSLAGFVEKRFGKVMYFLIVFITILYMGIALAAELTGIALAGKIAFGVPLGVTAVIIGLTTLIYTALGGFRVSVLTDVIQSYFIIPFLAVLIGIGLYFAGSITSVKTAIQNASPELLSLNLPGIEVGLTLIIGIVGAEFFNQIWWQRTYAAKSSKGMTSAYLFSGIIVGVIVFAISLFGLLAIANNAAGDPSVALFSFIISATPSWVVVLVMILAIALIMSSMDSLLNGLTSIFTLEFMRQKPKAKSHLILRFSYVITVLVAALAIFVATKGYSVLYLFLLADLFCVAAVFPVFYGMYQRQLSATTAIVSTILGLAVGLCLFPSPDFSTGNLFYSFAAALGIPLAVCLLFKSKKKFDFKKMKTVS